MIVCHRCGKENQDHYKFCLGCGAELTAATAKAPDADVGMMKTVLADPAKAATAAGKLPSPKLPGATPAKAATPAPVVTPSPAAASPDDDIPADERTNVGAPPGVGPSNPIGTYNAPAIGQAQAAPAPAPAPAARMCQNCNSQVPPAFKFCGVCGAKLPEETAPPPVASEAAPATATAVMTLIRPDGSEGGTHELQDGENMIGRNHGEIFENDGYLSPTHASLIVNVGAGTAVIKDLDSLNGVFVKMTDEEEIASGQIIRIGQELLRFDTISRPQPTEDGTEVMGSPNPGYWGKLTVVIGKDVDGSSYPLLGDSVTLGRERGEINFPDDGYVSGLHARLSIQKDKIVLSDLGSSNGTFVKLTDERELKDSSFVLLGQQLFRLSIG